MEPNEKEPSENSGRRTRRYTLRSKLLLLFATLLVCVLAAEALTRILHPPDRLEFVADDEVLWRIRPGQVGWVPIANYTRVSPASTVNRHGFRGRRELDPDDRRVRVLALGDSFTFGSGVGDDATFCAQLEALSDGKMAVVNAGVPGWGIFQEEIRLRRCIDEIKPDYVMVTFLEVDAFRQPFDTEDETKRFVSVAKLKNRVRSVSRLLTVTARVIERLRLESTDRGTPNVKVEQDSGDAGPSAEFRDCWEKDKERLLSMKQLCDRHAATLVLVAWPNRTKNSPYFLSEVARFGEQHGIVTVDLSEVLYEYPSSDLELPGDEHPNVRAHRLVGEEILRVAFNAGAP